MTSCLHNICIHIKGGYCMDSCCFVLTANIHCSCVPDVKTRKKAVNGSPKQKNTIVCWTNFTSFKVTKGKLLYWMDNIKKFCICVYAHTLLYTTALVPRSDTLHPVVFLSDIMCACTQISWGILTPKLSTLVSLNLRCIP